MLGKLSVNELITQLNLMVDPEDRDYVYVRIVVHDDDRPVTARAKGVSGGTGHPFVNILGVVGD